MRCDEIITLWGYRSTIAEWIAGVSVNASTDWCMINNIAQGIVSTGAWAGIDAFVSDTGFVAGTVWIDCTFRSAVGWRSIIVR